MPARTRSIIARRVVRMAVEDIGLADPQALVICNAAKDAYDFLGVPEGELAIAQAVIYVATAPKSNAAYMAYGAAMQAAKEARLAAAAEAHPQCADQADEAEGYGAGYDYDHDEPRGVFRPGLFSRKRSARQQFYDPPERGFEREIRKRLDYWAKLRKERKANDTALFLARCSRRGVFRHLRPSRGSAAGRSTAALRNRRRTRRYRGAHRHATSLRWVGKLQHRQDVQVRPTRLHRGACSDQRRSCYARP